MSQDKLRDYQKQLFEYDYTLKKIDNILISTRLPQEEREHYQLSREACQKAKNKTSQEMAEYAKQNRMSLLIAPLSKDEKEEIIQSMEKGGGESGEPIRFDNVRDESFYIEEEPFIPEVTAYKTKKLNEYAVNGAAEVNYEDLENKDVENDNLEDRDVEDDNLGDIDVENDNLEIEDLESRDIENVVKPEKNDFDFEGEQDFSDDWENDGNSLSWSPEVIDFIRSLKEELSIFYGEQ